MLVIHTGRFVPSSLIKDSTGVGARFLGVHLQDVEHDESEIGNGFDARGVHNLFSLELPFHLEIIVVLWHVAALQVNRLSVLQLRYLLLGVKKAFIGVLASRDHSLVLH